MKTKIIDYKGLLIIDGGSNMLAARAAWALDFLCVAKAEDVEITQGAFDIIKGIAKGTNTGPDFGGADLGVFATSVDGAMVGWSGGKKRLIDPNYVNGSSRLDHELLRPYIVPDFTIDPALIKSVEKIIEVINS